MRTIHTASALALAAALFFSFGQDASARGRTPDTSSPSTTTTPTTTSPQWLIGSWGKCSSRGVQTRTVSCKLNGRTTSASKCPQPKPDTRQSCTASAPAPTYSWISSAWSTCSKTCGTGTQTRSVSCRSSSGTTVTDGYCSASTKPAASQNCNTQACTASDTTPPTIPSSLTASAATCREVELSWTASSDSGSGVSHYNVYRDNSYLARVEAPLRGLVDGGVVASKTYGYQVEAWDKAGNPSGRSAARSVTTPACTASAELFTVPSVAYGQVRELSVDPVSQIAAVVSDGRDLVVVDLATRRVRSLGLAGTAIAVEVLGETVFVVESGGGGSLTLRRVDARKSLANLGSVASLSLPGSFNGVGGTIAPAGTLLYVAGSTAGLVVVDVSSGLRLQGTPWTAQPVVHVAVGNGVVLASGQRGSLAILDTSQPSSPRVSSVLNFSSRFVAMKGRLGLVWSGGVQELDLADPRAPRVRAVSDLLSFNMQFEYWENQVVELTTFSQLRFMQTDPVDRTFDLLGVANLSWQIAAWTTASDRLYAIDGGGTLRVLAGALAF
jgi:hypothetical protein